MEYPLDKLARLVDERRSRDELRRHVAALPDQPTDFLFEIGVEELPAADVDSALEQLSASAPKLLDDLRLAHGDIKVYATPRRLVVSVKDLATRQTDLEQVMKGPSADRAYDADGNPTKAAQGFARGKGVSVDDLRVEDGYVVATVREDRQAVGGGAGRSAARLGRGDQVRQVDALERQQRRLLAPDPLVRRAARRGGDRLQLR